jgi:leucyl-tRNA synthetase
MKRYNPKEIEPKWQQIWQESKIYNADLNSQKTKYIGFGMFNYPSGAGIHVGHVRNYTIPDVITRVKRQQGFEAYQPVGWDSFGLPAENFAIKTGVSPQESTKKAIEKYREQYRAMGWAVDWEKEINTADPSYYKWTQWTFLKLFENGLAYQKESPQWWCPHDKTVLADEQVENGRCWRCGHTVERKNLKQWFFKITDYADEILEATDDLDWTEAVKASQRGWIGKSQGALVDFATEDKKPKIQVFTTRPDTLYGATYMVLAPEHPLAEKLASPAQKGQVVEYIKKASRKSELERQEGAKNKTGVFTGSFAINPATKEKIPIWIADYVLMGYGTGAIMAVPAHDERDYEFALKYQLPIKEVIEPVFYQSEEPGAVKKELPFVERNAITAIVKHWSEDKYMGLKWKEVLWGTFITGGVEDGQTPEQAAIAEIQEETGYLNPVLKTNLGKAHSKFYHVPKKENRFAHFDCLYFELANGEQKQTSADEKARHEVVWLPAAEVENFITAESHLHNWETLKNNGQVYSGEGLIINSGEYNGLDSSEVRDKIVADLAKDKIAKEQTSYRLRDWLISRQRYWGAPIPVIHCPKCGSLAVPEKDLPVLLPIIKNYEPTGDNVSALAGVKDWVNVDCPKCGGKAKRETDTMDGYVCSSWYFLRYLSPHDDKQAWDSKLAQKWLPVDFYNGADHATAHLLYARFYMRFFFKLGLVGTPEPFAKMVYNGKVKAADGSAFSKSKGNGVDPLEIIESGYGADALRLYEMFAAPVDLDVLWDPQGVPGTHRFLSRAWTLVQEFLAAKKGGNSIESVGILRAANKTTKKVTKDIEAGKFNTAISSMMELVNELYKIKADEEIKQSAGWLAALETLTQLLAPFAPHIAEEMWQDLGHEVSVHVSNWPTWDEQLIKDEMMTLAVQVNGKVRSEIIVAADIDEKSAVEAAKADEKVSGYLKGKTINKAIYVPGRLVSLVIV